MSFVRSYTKPKVFGFTVLQLDMAYVREQLLPELVDRHRPEGLVPPAGDAAQISTSPGAK